MDNYITVTEMAARWKINVRTIQSMCASGRIKGAIKFGGIWAIPKDAEYPSDKRVVSGNYRNWRKNRLS